MTREQFVFNPKAPAWHFPSPLGGSWPSVRDQSGAAEVRQSQGIERTIDGVKFRFAAVSSRQQRNRANELVMKRYSWRGYDVEGALGGDDSAGEVTFIAHAGDRVVGTLTVRVDARTDLLAEDLYAEEIEHLRRQGRSVCEFVRLAFDEGINTLEVLGPLAHLGMAYAKRLHASTDLVIEVNPRHVGFYQRAFGGEVFGEERICNRVAAPASLLRLPLADALTRAHLLGGERVGRRSIYPYFLGFQENRALIRELALLDDDDVRDMPRSLHAYS